MALFIMYIKWNAHPVSPQRMIPVSSDAMWARELIAQHGFVFYRSV